MAIEFSTVGLFKMKIYNLHTGEEIQNGDFEQGILDNLQQGEYVISKHDEVILDINDLETPLYRFSLHNTDASDYSFDCSVCV